MFAFTFSFSPVVIRRISIRLKMIIDIIIIIISNY